MDVSPSPSSSSIVLAAAPTAGEMQLAVAEQHDAITRLQTELTNLKKNRDYYKNKCETLALRLRDSQQQCKDLVMKLSFRPGLRKISCYGG